MEKNIYNCETKNYVMKSFYTSNELYVASLAHYTNKFDDFGNPLLIPTEQKYLFTKQGDNYIEVFTGFIVKTNFNYLNIPIIVNIKSLKECVNNDKDVISKFSLLLLIDEINKKDRKIERVKN